jgi:Protein of unknown function (DUF2384)
MIKTPPQSSSRIGMKAHVDSTRLPFQELVIELTKVIGRKLTAYIAGVDDTRSVDRWMQGQGSYGAVESRLRFTYQVVVPLADHDSAAVVQSWLTGINPELGDRTPIRLLRDQDLELVGPELLRAMRSFVSGG